MSAQEHSPTPWRVEEATYVVDLGAISVADCDFTAVGSPKDAANATHIVRCVNAHDELVDAVEEVLEFIERHIGVDVVDGDYGEPKPDRAMQVAMMLKRTLDKVRS